MRADRTQAGDARPVVAVVGGGIAGLVAARRLAAADLHVTLLEAGARWGGKIRTVHACEATVDIGAEAVHPASPGIGELLAGLDLDGRTISARAGTTWLCADGRLRPLPDGFSPAGPSRLWPLVASGLLSPSGVLRAALEPLLARRPDEDDVAVGEFLTEHFGRQVVDRLVDPLLGGLHAGDVDRLSLRSATPQLAAVADTSRSLVLRRSPRSRAPQPMVTLDGGMQVLVDALVDDLTARGAGLRLQSPVLDIEARSDGYLLSTPDGDVAADAIVLALPSHRAAELLGPLAPRAVAAVAEQRSASVAVAVHRYPEQVLAEAPALVGSGVMVASGEGLLLKAATFLSSKWPHLRGEGQLVRLSAGRAGDDRAAAFDDDELSAALHADLAAITGVRSEPVDRAVVRWPRALPQLEVGHGEALRGVRDELEACHPRVALAGASYDGVGVAACVRSGAAAAQHVLTAAPVAVA